MKHSCDGDGGGGGGGNDDSRDVLDAPGVREYYPMMVLTHDKLLKPLNKVKSSAGVEQAASSASLGGGGVDRKFRV